MEAVEAMGAVEAVEVEAVPEAALSEAAAVPAGLVALPDDILEVLCVAVFMSGGWRHGLHALAALHASCRRLRDGVSAGPLLLRLDCLSAAADAGDAGDVGASGASDAGASGPPDDRLSSQRLPSGLEEIAVRCAVRDLIRRGGALVGFEFAGTALDDEAGTDSAIPGSRAILRAWARLLQRHPQVRVHIDAHVGPTAPRALAGVYSRRRGLSVATELMACGVAPGRLSLCGWGKLLVRRAACSSHPNSAPARMGYGWAELFARWPATAAVGEAAMREVAEEVGIAEAAAKTAAASEAVAVARGVAAAAAVTAEPGPPATATAEQVSKPVGTVEVPPRPGYYLGSLRAGARPPAVLCADEVSDGSEGGDSAEEHSSDDDNAPSGGEEDEGGSLAGSAEGGSLISEAEGHRELAAEGGEGAGGQNGAAAEEDAQLRRSLLAGDASEDSDVEAEAGMPLYACSSWSRGVA